MTLIIFFTNIVVIEKNFINFLSNQSILFWTNFLMIDWDQLSNLNLKKGKHKRVKYKYVRKRVRVM